MRPTRNLARIGALWAAILAASAGRADGPPGYDPNDGAGLIGMNPTYPQPTESGYNWSLSLRYTKQKLLNFATQEHNLDGTHRTNFLTTSMIADDAVTEPKLSSAVRVKLNSLGGTNAAATLLVTNALTYVTSQENSTWTGGLDAERVLGTLTLSSNTFRKVLVTAEVVFENASSGSRFFTLRLRTGGLTGTQVGVTGPHKTTAGVNLPIARSFLIAGGNNSDVLIVVTGQADNGNGSSARLETFRLWGIP